MNKILSFIVLFLLLFNFTPAFADTKSYEINKVDINAVIMDNGDVNVTEYLTYNFLGYFNGFFRNINSNGADGCVVNSITIIDKSGVETEAKVSSTGEENTYEISQNGYDTAIKLYSKSSNEKKTFKINYRIKNAAKKYVDKGELYWSFYSLEDIKYIYEANLTISLNNEQLTEKNSRYKTFGDGDLSTMYVNNGININYKSLTSMIGVDLTIPTEFLINSPTIANNNTSQENQNSNNNDILFEDNIDSSNSASSIIIILCAFGFVILVTTLAIAESKKQNDAMDKYRNEYEFISNIKYIEAPSNISPALVNLLIYNQNISRDMLSSTLLYLCNLGYYNVEEIEYIEKRFLGDKVRKNLRFKRNINKILPSENHLEFIIKLFENYETNNEFSMLELQDLLKSKSEGKNFIDKIIEWEKQVREDAEVQGYYITIRNSRILTNEFYNEKLKWLSYKKFVEDNINFKERLNELNTADTIIIYAKALGINNGAIEKYINKLTDSTKTEKDLDINYLNNINNTYYFNYYLNYMHSMNLMYIIATPDNSSSNNDSGGGFTGGSSGGDFGGGGGGGSGSF